MGQGQDGLCPCKRKPDSRRHVKKKFLRLGGPEARSLLAGVRLSKGAGDSWADVQPEGYLRLDAELRDNVQLFAEATATAKHMGAVTGLKITW